jgi:hypothetical protein
VTDFVRVSPLLIIPPTMAHNSEDGVAPQESSSIPYWFLKSVGLFSYPTLIIIHCKQTVHSSLLYISKVEVIKKKSDFFMWAFIFLFWEVIFGFIII